MIFDINTTCDISKLSPIPLAQRLVKLRIRISKYHSWYLCQISLQIMLLTKIMDMLVEFQVWEIMTADTQCQFYLNRWPNKIVESSLPYCLKDFCSKQGELKKKAVYNPTKGTLLLRLNRENGWGKYEIEPKNSGCFWTLFFTWYRLDGDRVLHTLWPKI